MVAVSLALTWAGSDLHGQALLFSSFPIALLIADPTLRRERIGRLISSATLIYALVLGAIKLGDVL